MRPQLANGPVCGACAHPHLRCEPGVRRRHGGGFPCADRLDGLPVSVRPRWLRWGSRSTHGHAAQHKAVSIATPAGRKDAPAPLQLLPGPRTITTVAERAAVPSMLCTPLLPSPLHRTDRCHWHWPCLIANSAPLRTPRNDAMARRSASGPRGLHHCPTCALPFTKLLARCLQRAPATTTAAPSAAAYTHRPAPRPAPPRSPR